MSTRPTRPVANGTRPSAAVVAKERYLAPGQVRRVRCRRVHHLRLCRLSSFGILAGLVGHRRHRGPVSLVAIARRYPADVGRLARLFDSDTIPGADIALIAHGLGQAATP